MNSQGIVWGLGTPHWNLGTLGHLSPSLTFYSRLQAIQLPAFLPDPATLLVTSARAHSQGFQLLSGFVKQKILFELCVWEVDWDSAQTQIETWASIVPHLSPTVLCHSLAWDHIFCGGLLYILLCCFAICIIRCELGWGVIAGPPLLSMASPTSRQFYE